MAKVIPQNVHWIKDSCVEINPARNEIRLLNNNSKELPIRYKYLIVAAGLQLDFDRIEGLVDALENNAPGVCSNYSPQTVDKTFKSIQNLLQDQQNKNNNNNAVFTFPNTLIKCPGAPQKIMYLTDAYLRKVN